MGNPKVRVDIPSNPSERLNLSARIYAKHLADGDKSPLNALLTHRWEDNGPLVAVAQTHNSQAEDLQRQANLEYRKRDLSQQEIDESVKSSRDLLLGIFRDNPKELSQWGFDVSDTPKATKKQE